MTEPMTPERLAKIRERAGRDFRAEVDRLRADVAERAALASDDGVQCGHWQCAIAADDDEVQP